MKKLNKSEAINQILKIDKIQLRFNLNTVPWWVGGGSRASGWPCEESTPQNSWNIFFILGRIRRSIA